MNFVLAYRQMHYPPESCSIMLMARMIASIKQVLIFLKHSCFTFVSHIRNLECHEGCRMHYICKYMCKDMLCSDCRMLDFTTSIAVFLGRRISWSAVKALKLLTRPHIQEPCTTTRILVVVDDEIIWSHEKHYSVNLGKPWEKMIFFYWSWKNCLA